MSLAGKVGIVTGAGRGIGKGIALALAKEGATVVLTDIKLESVTKVQSEVESMGYQALALKTDVTNFEEIKGMVQKTLDTFEHIDILVNNAGVDKIVYFQDIEEKDWDIIMDTNSKGIFLCCKAVVPHMIKQRSGKIINISSVAGKVGFEGQTAYCASKSAVIGFTQALAKELAPNQINVNAICPGSVETDIWKNLCEEYARLDGGISAEEYNNKMVTQIPTKRLQTVEDIGNMTVFLASEKAKNVTGQAINVDGGRF